MVEILRAQRIKTGSHLLVTFQVDGYYRPFLAKLFRAGSQKTDDRYTLKIDLPRRPRTTGEGSQSHHINGHVQQIAMETGASFQAVKEYAKAEAVSEGWGFTTLPNGDVLANSESTATVEQASVLIEVLHRLAAEWSIHLVEE
jgi:hypothetical protein